MYGNVRCVNRMYKFNHFLYNVHTRTEREVCTQIATIFI